MLIVYCLGARDQKHINAFLRPTFQNNFVTNLGSMIGISKNRITKIIVHNQWIYTYTEHYLFIWKACNRYYSNAQGSLPLNISVWLTNYVPSPCFAIRHISRRPRAYKLAHDYYMKVFWNLWKIWWSMYWPIRRNLHWQSYNHGLITITPILGIMPYR